MGIFDQNGAGAGRGMPPQAPGQLPVGLPIQQVNSMKQQGMSDNMIVQALQRDGYKTHQIFDAMSQAELVSGAPRRLEDMPQSTPGGPQIYAGSPPPSYPGQQPDLPQMPQYSQAPPMPPPQQFQTMPSQPQMQMPMDASNLSVQQIEEIAESIIEEKWTELAKGVTKIIEWKEKMENRINDIDARLTSLKNDFDELHRGVLGKIGEYDRNVGAVGTDIKAMQRAFSQMLPTFTDNINELSRLTKNYRLKNP